MPELNLVDGLYTYSKPGLNCLEREWYHENVISNEGVLLEYQKLAEKVAESKDIPVTEVYQSLLDANDNTAKALEFFGAFFVEVQLIQTKEASRSRNAPSLMAEMIIRSRLKPSWINAKSAELLTIYGFSLKPNESDHLSDLPRSKWLADEQRAAALFELTTMLPSWQIRDLAKFVENELLEGADPTMVTPQPIEKTLGKHESDLSKQQKPPPVNVESSNKLTEVA
ncbi:MAG: hypothetical protein F6K11_18125 [Leptolyngbya sp. SIO3F4]|nr:hypothetical protein [Leptolyngbya sp. SIO3F4]